YCARPLSLRRERPARRVSTPSWLHPCSASALPKRVRATTGAATSKPFEPPRRQRGGSHLCGAFTMPPPVAAPSPSPADRGPPGGLLARGVGGEMPRNVSPDRFDRDLARSTV